MVSPQTSRTSAKLLLTSAPTSANSTRLSESSTHARDGATFSAYRTAPTAIPKKKSSVKRERILFQLSDGCVCWRDRLLVLALPEAGRLAGKPVRTLPVAVLCLTADF